MDYSTDKEIWKDIEGYEGYYKISNFGRIRSMDRVTSNGRSLKGKLAKLQKTKGYTSLTLHKDSKRKRFLVSRLVAIHFLENPMNKKEVNHIDENKDNNHVDNLEWCTPKENANHGTRNKRIAEWQKNNPCSMRDSKSVVMLEKDSGKVLKVFETINEAYKYLGKNANGHISYACKGKYKSAYGYKWDYI